MMCRNAGVAGHVSLADPVCETLRGYLLEATKEKTDNYQDKGYPQLCNGSNVALFYYMPCDMSFTYLPLDILNCVS